MEPKDKSTGNSNPDQTNLAWELLSKGKKKAQKKISKPEEDFGSI